MKKLFCVLICSFMILNTTYDCYSMDWITGITVVGTATGGALSVATVVGVTLLGALGVTAVIDEVAKSQGMTKSKLIQTMITDYATSIGQSVDAVANGLISGLEYTKEGYFLIGQKVSYAWNELFTYLWGQKLIQPQIFGGANYGTFKTVTSKSMSFRYTDGTHFYEYNYFYSSPVDIGFQTTRDGGNINAYTVLSQTPFTYEQTVLVDGVINQHRTNVNSASIVRDKLYGDWGGGGAEYSEFQPNLAINGYYGSGSPSAIFYIMGLNLSSDVIRTGGTGLIGDYSDWLNGIGSKLGDLTANDIIKLDPKVLDQVNVYGHVISMDEYLRILEAIQDGVLDIDVTDVDGVKFNIKLREKPGTVDIETPTTPPPSTPTIPTDVGDLGAYQFDLTYIFPFCLPFDLVRIVKIFNVPPSAPNFTYLFSVPQLDFEYLIDIDFSDFETMAAILRVGQDILFTVGLVFITSKLIKW